MGITTALVTNPSESGVWARPLAKAMAVTLSGAELVVDKRSQTPSRLRPSGLAPRILFGAASAALLARRHGTPLGLPVAVGAVTAGVSAFIGYRVRHLASERFGDLPGALIEDFVVVFLAWRACS